MTNEIKAEMNDYTSIANQYSNKSTADIETQIKRYESTALTFMDKGKREWAYAKNGMGDDHYGYAKRAFKTAAENQAKANELKLLLKNRNSAYTKAFVGNAGTRLTAAETAAAVGVALAAVTAVAEGMAKGDEPEEIAKHFAEYAVSNAVAGYASVNTAAFVTLLSGSYIPGFLAGATAGCLVGGLALSAARGFSEGLDNAIRYDDPTWIPRAIAYSVEDWADDTEEAIGELGYKLYCTGEDATNAVGELCDNICDGVSDFLLTASSFFNGLL